MMRTHRSVFALVTLVAFGAGVVRAEDPPPDRLQKKPRPAEPTPPGLPPKPAEKPDEGKDPPKDDPTQDATKLRESIAQDMQSAEKKLKDRNPGRDTQQLQDRVLRNIDKLLDLARNPPPPPQQPPQPMDGSPPPMGGDGRPMGGEGQKSGQKPQGGSQSQPGGQQQPENGQSPRERREQRRQQMQQQARGGQQPRSQPGGQLGGGPRGGGEQLTPNPGQAGSGGQKTNGPPDKMADVVKDIWGHLPETLRQEVDHYYRDRFMPRYRDLLQEYYGRLAERDRARREDRR